MIEITHQQARQLVRDSVDTPGTTRSRITQEQWAALQAHLENCAECREYAGQVRSFEKELARALQIRLRSFSGPTPGLFRGVMDRRRSAQARSAGRKRVLSWLGAIAVLVGLILARGAIFSPPAPPVAATPAPESSPVSPPTPTPKGTFRGLIAFEGRQEGNAEVYLLNAGPNGSDLTNLTLDPAQDTSPAWSPDGEWIAFLSDRTGSNEIYVISIAGSRLTRLTAAPDLVWRGPLSWSADGQWIAARALRRDQANETYVYLVPLDGRNELRSVAYSRGALGAPLFSPGQLTLAFQSAITPGLIYDYGIRSGWYAPFNAGDLAGESLRSAGLFDWTAGGTNLVYLAEGPYAGGAAPQLAPDAVTQIRFSPNLFESNPPDQQGTHSRLVASARGIGAYRAITSMPGSSLAAAAQDPDGDGCWSVSLYEAYTRRDPVDLEGMCLEGTLSRQSWQVAVDGESGPWLVALARHPGKDVPGFLAARLPLSLPPETISLLANPVEEIGVPGLTLSADSSGWPGVPQVRPTRGRLSINPFPASFSGLLAEPLLPGPEVDQDLALVSAGAGGNSLAYFNPAGGLHPLPGGDGEPSCPALSPDGSRVAAVFTPTGEDTGGRLGIVQARTRTPYALSSLADLPPGDYACPTWSPDGTRLAAQVRMRGLSYLGIFSADGSQTAQFLRIPSLPVPPAWIPGEAGADRIMLVYPGSIYEPLRIVSIDLDSAENKIALQAGADAQPEVIAEIPGTGQASAFAASPDGKQFALVRVSYNSAFTLVTSAQLIVSNGIGMTLSDLGGYDPDRAAGNSLTWLGDGRVGLIQPLPLDGSIKTRVQIYDPGEAQPVDRLSVIAALGDMTDAAAWSADARWVFLGGESGLYALDVQNARAGTAVPARLLADWVVEID